MCGIVGYIGSKEAFPVLLKGLKRLEYRGYDSAGVALVSTEHGLNIYKQKGKVSELELLTIEKNCCGSLGIAHTRWATHGEPNQLNAHPHTSQSGCFALVHNGIIENYSDLRSQLEVKGYTFQSQTDTEVLVQLIEYCYATLTGKSLDEKKSHKDLLSAMQLALQKVIGAYAICLLDRYDPELMLCARKSSPLAIGLTDSGEYYIASDATPIVEYTDQIVYLNDEEIALLRTGKSLKIIDLKNTEVTPEIQTIDMDIESLEKGGYPHFMLKEIFEQPKSIRECMKGRVSEEGITLNALRTHKETLSRAKRILIVACGTSWHAGLIGKYLIEEFCRIPVTVEYASEFRYANPILYSDDVVIAISQSGETADTLAAIRQAKEQGCFVLGVCNAVGSSIPRSSDSGCYIHVGPEIGVASTKAFTGQVTALSMLALSLGYERGTLPDTKYHALLKELLSIPDKMEEVLRSGAVLETLSRSYAYVRNFIYLGRGYNYPVALEGALKLKEISYIHAEGYPAAEMKHGPIALIDSEMPVVFIATRNEMYEKVLSNIQEVKSRGGRILAIVNDGDTEVTRIADRVVSIPRTMEPLEPLLTVLPLQLLSYYVALYKGLNVDQPRNLAKSVTVE